MLGMLYQYVDVEYELSTCWVQVQFKDIAVASSLGYKEKMVDISKS